jgi:hypothetical protein
MDEYIEIEKDLIPYHFDLALDEVIFTFQVEYNPDFDFFTIDLECDGELLVAGQKIVYGIPLFDGIQDARFPVTLIVPYDTSETATRVSWDNLGTSVFLYLYRGDEA